MQCLFWCWHIEVCRSMIVVENKTILIKIIVIKIITFVCPRISVCDFL